ncbi:preprotein translocase subunit SecD [Streptomyces sp. NPDC002889]|uniref:preprotein translocase subunit SecD n=1 Tax=Streptomyces sp. NPDC002889 TaxID=3364669 RepID=UPI003687A326
MRRPRGLTALLALVVLTGTLGACSERSERSELSESGGGAGQAAGPSKGADGPDGASPRTTTPVADGSQVPGWTSVTFSPETPRTAGKLRQAADRMKQRAVSLGLKDVRVDVTGGDITTRAAGDSEKRLTALGQTGALAFRPVVTVSAATAGKCEDLRREAALRDSESVTVCGGTEGAEALDYVLEPASLVGSDVAGAKAQLDSNSGSWIVSLTFTSKGAVKFADVTGELATQQSPMNQFAIVLDEKVLSAPAVSQSITGGQAQISGAFTKESARELASLVEYGALPVRLKVSSVTRFPSTAG